MTHRWIFSVSLEWWCNIAAGCLFDWCDCIYLWIGSKKVSVNKNGLFLYNYENNQTQRM